MPIKLNRLTALGFVPAGKWLLEEQSLKLVLDNSIAKEANVLYAFAVNGALAYVGKTAQSLQKRMQGYKSPSRNAATGATTNIKNNRNILSALNAGHTVDIFIFSHQPLQRHGEFEVNLSAGLEDSLINALSPPWNGRDTANLAAIESRENSAIPATIPVSGSSEEAQLSQTHSRIEKNIQGSSILLSAEKIFAFAGNHQGEIFLTLRRKSPFRVEVVGNFLEITPGSSKISRRESREQVASLLKQFAKSGSFQMSDYSELTFNASYILALIKCLQRNQSQSST
jgi:hypothetical protein